MSKKYENVLKKIDICFTTSTYHMKTKEIQKEGLNFMCVGGDNDNEK